MSIDTERKITEHLNHFRERFKDLLDENSLKVAEFSNKVGIAKSRLYSFLKPPGSPSLKNALKISDYFQCSLDYLFGFGEDFLPKIYHTTETVTVRIKIAIDKSKFSRYKISQETGIEQSELSKWYNGKKTPTLVNLLALADILNCSFDFLAGRED